MLAITALVWHNWDSTNIQSCQVKNKTNWSSYKRQYGSQLNTANDGTQNKNKWQLKEIEPKPIYTNHCPGHIYLNYTLQSLIHIPEFASHSGDYFLKKCIIAYLYTLRFCLTARQTWIISNPIFSPSLSQSVQIMSDPHCRTSFSNVRCKQKRHGHENYINWY